MVTIKTCKDCKKQFVDTSKNRKKYCYDCKIKNIELSHAKYVDRRNATNNPHATQRPETLQCAICGLWYRKVASHVYYAHNTTARDYKKMLGLDNKKGLISSNMKATLQSYTTKYKDIVITQNLINRGKKTRYQKAHTQNYTRTPSQKERLRKQGIINLKNKINI